MRDNEIIKALECCTKAGCLNCPLCTPEHTGTCVKRTMLGSIDLIKRQKTEIEKLKIDDECLVTQIKDAYEQIHRLSIEKSEVVKEFAERLKEKNDNPGKAMFDVYEYYGETIDNFVKEMTEGKENA